MGRVVCLSRGHGVIFQNGVTAGAFIGNGGFESWISLCVMLREYFFSQASNAWKTLRLASGFELEQHKPPPTDQHCSLLGRC